MLSRLFDKGRVSRRWQSVLPYLILFISFVFVLVLVVGSFALLIDLFYKSLPLAIGLGILMGLVFIWWVRTIERDIEDQRYNFD